MKEEYSRRNYSTGGAGFKKPGTSQEAARRTNKNLTKRESEVFRGLIGLGGKGTADEVSVFLNYPITVVRPRFTGLLQKKLIRETGETKPSRMGNPSAVMEVIYGG